tara:strand:- start:130 stop:486 length:357 start_codon:yes stop_codon:yes gene_type:complete
MMYEERLYLLLTEAVKTGVSKVPSHLPSDKTLKNLPSRMSGATRAVIRGMSTAGRSGDISGAAQEVANQGEQPGASFISRLMAPFARKVQKRHLKQQGKGIDVAKRAYPLVPRTRTRK